LDEAERWLKKNDPDFANTKKRRNMEYPYLTNYQERYRLKKDIPISSLWRIKDRIKVKQEEVTETEKFLD